MNRHTDQVRLHAESLVADRLDRPDDAHAVIDDRPSSIHAADAQLIDALLRHHLATAPERAARADRLNRLIEALHAEPETVTHDPGPRRTPRHRAVRLRRVATRWSALLIVGVIVTAWWIGITGPTAAAALDFAIAAADRPLDRTYRVVIESQEGAPIGFRKEARIDTRGGDVFVVRRPTPFGRDIVFGSNGTESWVVSPTGAVTIHDGTELLDRWRTRREAMLPFHNVKETLAFLDAKYDLEITPRAALPGVDRELIHVRGDRSPGAGLGPTHAEIWCDAATGDVIRLALHLPIDWSPSGHAARVTFELVSEEPLPADWFEPERHAD